ncbi:hypothetical protein BOO69_09010 [Sulfitobacter alexandrii]|uniref:Uncharacterized protein n=1 Tax=Sulfitobacter alexandrii TaxID=1917485 RepID=A0A1J0WGU1_9RHOB|nr:DUF6065 family protein [Sulfitobacter alexandrii]APE43535.1 hypothetical protein BOO69_09010 [Sulfitobacter alexandrii]
MSIDLRLALDPAWGIELRPAPARRDWMDATPQGYANRCLPLTIANAHGWELLNPTRFVATWTGGQGIDDVVVAGFDDARSPLAVSHFGAGILTFQVPGLIRTSPGYDLWLQGPVNRPKPHIQGLTGVVETDWSPFGLTMNWRFTTVGATVAFEAGEPFAHLFPMPRGLIEAVTPRVMAQDAGDPDQQAHRAWARDRERFIADLGEEGSDARRAGWQRDYMRGPERPVDPPHRTRLRPKPPAD